MSEENESKESETPEETTTETPTTPPDTTPESESKTEPESDFEPVTAEALKLPEGVTLDEEQAGALLAITNEHKLPAEVVQNLYDMHYADLQKAQNAANEAWVSTMKEWTEAVKKDPDIGGEQLDANLGQIHQTVKEFGGDEAFQALDITGVGNHPAFIKMMHKISKALGEGEPAAGGPSTGTKPSHAERLYGSN